MRLKNRVFNPDANQGVNSKGLNVRFVSVLVVSVSGLKINFGGKIMSLVSNKFMLSTNIRK